MTNIAVIIVTHNSSRVLFKCLESLSSQTAKPAQIIIVDSHSEDTDYIDLASQHFKLPVILIKSQTNVGFAKANNLGIAAVANTIDIVIFLNPDCFLSENCLAPFPNLFIKYPLAGVITCTLLGFDINQNKPTGLIDSTGIFKTWYGNWFDRNQGESICNGFDNPPVQAVPAICGAFMVCRKQAVEQLIQSDGFLFNEAFFMYKEDIEFSIRMRQLGWQLLYISDITAYHCRGWLKSRRAMPQWSRLASARNELYIAVHYNLHGVPYSFMKYVYTKFIEPVCFKLIS